MSELQTYIPEMLKLALAQINPTVGDIRGNTVKIISYINKARVRKADVVIFPELAMTGYPPEDLLDIPGFVNSNLEALDKIKHQTGGITAIVGFADRDTKGFLYNSAALLSNKRMLGIYHKMHLPNYGVFDEKRYFTAGTQCPVFRAAKTALGINICEDIWMDRGPVDYQAKQGKAEIIINISSSPFHTGKYFERQQILRRRANENKIYIVYVNLIGGQDELVFDGRSMVFNPAGELIAQAKAFKEDLLVVDIPQEIQNTVYKVQATGEIGEIYEALKLGLKDYIRKNGFKKVLIGLSGGIDSALTALIAVDALGRGNVHGFYLPSEFSSQLSKQCTLELAHNLGIKLVTVSIKDIYQKYLKSLGLSGKITLTHENLQSRIRGTILMALSNTTGAIVLTTGNKSEMSTGYATLYGDMAGGFALIKDVPKTMVYKLSSYGNDLFYNKTGKYPISAEIITRPPTAELKPNQKDSDTLPDYEVLDLILQAYIEENRSLDEIIQLTGAPLKVVERVIRMVSLSEYKRRQSPPGVKITPRAFGKDRRFPITNRFS
ncbi:MAG: NAD+ synthase [Planctomycetes bacterium]|nr:NAD+ synthase [Planctomycetota bacterium]